MVRRGFVPRKRLEQLAPGVGQRASELSRNVRWSESSPSGVGLGCLRRSSAPHEARQEADHQDLLMHGLARSRDRERPLAQSFREPCSTALDLTPPIDGLDSPVRGCLSPLPHPTTMPYPTRIDRFDRRATIREPARSGRIGDRFAAESPSSGSSSIRERNCPRCPPP